MHLITTARFQRDVHFNLISFSKQIEAQFVFVSHFVTPFDLLASFRSVLAFDKKQTV